jgi:hypothetical protein
LLSLFFKRLLELFFLFRKQNALSLVPSHRNVKRT